MIHVTIIVAMSDDKIIINVCIIVYELKILIEFFEIEQNDRKIFN